MVIHQILSAPSLWQEVFPHQSVSGSETVLKQPLEQAKICFKYQDCLQSILGKLFDILLRNKLEICRLFHFDIGKIQKQ